MICEIVYCGSTTGVTVIIYNIWVNLLYATSQPGSKICDIVVEVVCMGTKMSTKMSILVYNLK